VRVWRPRPGVGALWAGSMAQEAGRCQSAGSRPAGSRPPALSRHQAQLEAEALMANREPAPWIFPSEAGTPLDYSRVANTFRWLLRRAGLPRFRPYDLRHTHATQLLESGAPITYVAHQLGHAKPTTTFAYYAHWLPRDDRTYIDRLIGSRTAVAPI
jgi:integrase